MGGADLWVLPQGASPQARGPGPLREPGARPARQPVLLDWGPVAGMGGLWWWPEWGVRVQRGHPYCAPSAWCLTCSWEPFLPSSKPAAGRGLSTLAGRSRGADWGSPAVRAVGHRALPQGQAPAPPPVLQAEAAHSVAAACAGPVPGTFWRCLPWHRGLEPGGVSSCHWRIPRPLHRVFLVASWGLSLGTGQVLVAVRAVGVADRGAPGAGLRPSGWGTRVGSVPTGLSMAPF